MIVIKAIALALIIGWAAVHPAGPGETVDPTTDRNPTCGYTVTEDSTGPYPCGWDCVTFGNGLCGPYGVTPHSVRRA